MFFDDDVFLIALKNTAIFAMITGPEAIFLYRHFLFYYRSYVPAASLLIMKLLLLALQFLVNLNIVPVQRLPQVFAERTVGYCSDAGHGAGRRHKLCGNFYIHGRHCAGGYGLP